jgi:hypothetical protein
VTSDPDTFVAVVADEAAQGADTREVRAYLCDSQSINEWLTGTATGNVLDLTSEGGVRLEGELASGTATGTATLADETSLSFEAPPATGVGGLFNVTVSADGQLSGTSERGGRIEGQLGDLLRQDGRYLLTGTITSPEGETQDFEASTAAELPVEGRFIFLNDGQVKGGKQRASTGFIDPTMDD